MGNYVIAGVGNYVIENPSDLGNFMIADIQDKIATDLKRLDQFVEGGLDQPHTWDPQNRGR